MNNCSLDQLNSFEDGVIRCSRSKSLISDITKYLNIPTPKSSKQNVELGLEIEINESVQRVLRDEDGSDDDLLAVTIIRPSDSKLVHETTVALSKDDVKEFIALVERHRTKHQYQPSHQLTDKKSEKLTTKKTNNVNKKELLKTRIKDKESKEKVKVKKMNYGSRESKESKESKVSKTRSSKDTINSHGECKEKERKRKTRSSTKHLVDSMGEISNPQPSNPSKYSKVHLSTFGENAKQVYTTINTFDKLKEVLPCQNKYRSDKPGVPCICPNCGIMDVLVQSQKGPVVEFPPLDEVRQNDRERKEKQHRRETKRHQPSSLDIDILKEINVRINNLEKRLAVQEETAVSKDYLKHVLHKIFAQYKNE